jgi:formamidopyrimidine-DNA glycosylase
MPELPEVETYRKYFDKYVLNKKIASVSHIDSFLLKDGMDPVELAGKLKGIVLTAAKRHGKYLFLKAPGPQYLILHFGMTGYPEFMKDCRCIPDHTRILLDFGDSCLALVDTRRLGMIYLYDDMNSFLMDKRLGPDALNINMETFMERLSVRNKPIKAALMDQSIIAGVGNLYADEILFQSSVHPLSRCSNLDEGVLQVMYKNMKQVLTAAVNVGANMEKYPKDWLLSHRKKEALCSQCGDVLKIIKVGGRTTYFCPNTQKRF